jgi:hypothetical protein
MYLFFIHIYNIQIKRQIIERQTNSKNQWTQKKFLISENKFWLRIRSRKGLHIWI